MRRVMRGIAGALLAISLLGACSATAGVDTTDNGVKVSGDVNAKD